jgi:hypothetical protein
VQLPQKKKKRNKGIRKRKGANKGNQQNTAGLETSLDVASTIESQDNGPQKEEQPHDTTTLGTQQQSQSELDAASPCDLATEKSPDAFLTAEPKEKAPKKKKKKKGGKKHQRHGQTDDLLPPGAQESPQLQPGTAAATEATSQEPSMQTTQSTDNIEIPQILLDSGSSTETICQEPSLQETEIDEAPAAPKRVRTRKYNKRGKQGKAKPAKKQGGRRITLGSDALHSSEPETDPIAAGTEHLGKAASDAAMAEVIEEESVPSIPETPISESDLEGPVAMPMPDNSQGAIPGPLSLSGETSVRHDQHLGFAVPAISYAEALATPVSSDTRAMAPGSSEPSTAAVTLSQEVPIDTSTPSFVGCSTQRKRNRHSKLHEKVRRAKQSQKKKDGKLERASESSVSTGNVEKTTGAEDPIPSPPTSPIPTPPPQLAALSTVESGDANLDETTDARGIEGETAPWSPFMNPWARPDTAAGRLPDAQYHRSGCQIVSSGGAVTREGRLTEPEGSCRARGFSMCGFYRACCYHRQRDLCGCPPHRSCCCLHHAGDCCHCLGPEAASAELLSEHPDGVLTRPWVPRQGSPGSDTVPSRPRALTG